MSSYQSELGKYLRDLRNAKGKTLHQVSMVVDIDSPLLSKIERGERLPTDKQIKNLSEFYEIPEKDLKVKLTAEKIIKQHGFNNTTLEAVQLVNEKMSSGVRTIKKGKK